MNTSNMKKMIVLRDLPSNIVEEAIVVLKSNINIKNYKLVENKKIDIRQGKINEKTGEYIIKEAESVISSYISSLEQPKKIEKKNKEIQKKYNRLKAVCLFWGIIATLSILINII